MPSYQVNDGSENYGRNGSYNNYGYRQESNSGTAMRERDLDKPPAYNGKHLFIVHSKGNSARSHMCILLVSHYSLILRNKKHCRKFEYNDIDYNLKKLFQYLASNNQY